jgi:BlaI family penicillinase repressor
VRKRNGNDVALQALSRRERQIMDVIYHRGQASAAEVRAGIPDPPSYSAVRAQLAVLERKGLVTHTRDKARYVYRPVHRRDNAGRSALRRVLRVFYDGSLGQAVAALLDSSEADLSPEEVEHLSRLIAQARKEGK